MEKRFLNTKDVAVYLGLSEHTIRAWVKLRRIPFSKFGRAVRFDMQKISSFVDSKEKCFDVLDFHLRRD